MFERSESGRRWYTAREAQSILGVRRTRITQLKNQGQLIASYDANGDLQISCESVERCLAARAAESVPPEERERRKAIVEAEQRRFRKKREREREEKERADREFRDRLLNALERIADGVSRRP